MKIQGIIWFRPGDVRGQEHEKDKKFMNLRKDTHEGKTVEIVPHVKVANKEPRLLRVHFYADHDRKIIVVGHGGGHPSVREISSARNRRVELECKQKL